MYTYCRTGTCFPGRNCQRASRLRRRGVCSAASGQCGKPVGPHRWRENPNQTEAGPAIEKERDTPLFDTVRDTSRRASNISNSAQVNVFAPEEDSQLVWYREAR